VLSHITCGIVDTSKLLDFFSFHSFLSYHDYYYGVGSIRLIDTHKYATTSMIDTHKNVKNSIEPYNMWRERENDGILWREVIDLII